VLLCHAVTLNVAINSHNNMLLTILISNNFAEVKGNVFKRFSKENVHKLASQGSSPSPPPYQHLLSPTSPPSQGATPHTDWRSPAHWCGHEAARCWHTDGGRWHPKV